MNCKFCGNFVPNGSESCPVCGRRGDERPIAELLAENKPAAPIITEDEEPNKKKVRTSLVMPIFLTVVGAIGWFYFITNGFIDKITTSIRELTGGNTGIGSGSEFETGGAVLAGNAEAAGLGTAGLLIVVLFSLLLLIGVVMFLVRIANRIKFSRDN